MSQKSKFKKKDEFNWQGDYGFIHLPRPTFAIRGILYIFCPLGS
jgi:hypothetical protein